MAGRELKTGHKEEFLFENSMSAVTLRSARMLGVTGDAACSRNACVKRVKTYLAAEE